MQRYKRLLGVLLFLGLLLAIFEFSGLRGHLNLEFLRQTILQHQISGLLSFVLLFSLGNLVQIPGWLFLAAAVLALGGVWGGIVTYVAAVISCTVTFLAIRFLGGDALRELNNKTIARILRRLDAHPVSSIVLLRMLFLSNHPCAELRAGAVWRQLAQLPAGNLAGLALAYCLVLRVFRFAGPAAEDFIAALLLCPRPASRRGWPGFPG